MNEEQVIECRVISGGVKLVNEPCKWTLKQKLRKGSVVCNQVLFQDNQKKKYNTVLKLLKSVRVDNGLDNVKE